MTTKTLYLICYDIQKDKSRNKIAQLLSEYGKRVNFSVFECFVTSNRMKKIYEKLEKLSSNKTDYIKIYPICKSCFMKSQSIGNEQYSSQNHSLFL